MSGTSFEEVSPSRLVIPNKLPYRIQTAILLNRSPMLTHPPTPFETAYYEYNAHIARALFNPFPKDFYFKPGSVLEKQFRREERRREKEAFNWGRRPGSQKRPSGRREQGKRPRSNIGIMAKEEEEVIMPRRTEADEKGDVKSLDRKGHRNLYLLIKKSKGRDEWRLPGGTMGLQGQELLHEVRDCTC
jgi:large subunit ribosomal protein L46